jgi:signal transduction histidine kinase
MVSSVAGSGEFGLSALFDIADETQRLMETSARLADKTAELERTATQLREVNARLRALDQQKDDFLSQVSHELRTPMTSIRSFAELLMSESLEPEQTRRFAGIIHEESLRLTRLLDEILDVNRLESGAAELPLEVVDAGAAVARALESLTPVARAAGVEIERGAPLDGQYVRANPDRLLQVLLNLVGNAIKYNADPAPRVRIDWHADAKALSIDVIDNGGGVSRAEAEQIFSKFVRGDRSGATQGAGLGLPISRAIMSRMGGALTVVFADDGSSFFRLRLPRAAAPAAEVPRAAE